MAQALYAPQIGYYAKHISAIGYRGDFTTAPMLSKAPALAVANWVRHAMRKTGCRNMIEIGPGEGFLASAVLKNLPWPVRWRTRLHLVETSIPLKKRQQKLLGNRATWHRDTQGALAACDGKAVIFSNELVDAFPVRRFQKSHRGWQELAVCFDSQQRATESLLPVCVLPNSSGFLESHPIGQRIEVHDSYRDYLTDWLPFWKSGRMLTIDYGSVAKNLYHRRPHGTIRAYLMQQRLEGAAIYENVGRQDLTADVNFTDLMRWSEPWISGQKLICFGEFLRDHKGISDDELTREHGASDAFQVLEQRR